MSAFNAANVTKYKANGTGDNIIADGYIKTVEKIWADTFTYTAVISTTDTIAIASIGPGRKITAVEVYVDFTAPTNCTINVGTSDDTDRFISAAPLTAVDSANLATGSKKDVRMNRPDGFLYATTGSTDTLIYLSLPAIASVTPTAGTIKTIVRYT
jgi:hypothetical protein